jgi:hypothetical protein
MVAVREPPRVVSPEPSKSFFVLALIILSGVMLEG